MDSRQEPRRLLGAGGAESVERRRPHLQEEEEEKLNETSAIQTGHQIIHF
jgi:hypothetical protein